MPAETKTKGKGVKKAPGQKRTKTGCASCRRRRAKCDEVKPRCTRCVKAGPETECLWPLDLPKDQLFQPYHHQSLAASAYIEPLGSSPSSPAASSSGSINAVASSSRSIIVPPTHQLQQPSRTTLYKSPTSTLELSYPDSGERMLMHHFLCMLHIGLEPERPDALHAYPSCAPPQSLEHMIPCMDLREFLSSPTRSTMAHEAISLGLLSTGACYLAFLHHQSACHYLYDSDPDLAMASLESEASYVQLSASLLASSFAMVTSSQLVLALRRPRPGLPFKGQPTASDVSSGQSAGLDDGLLDQLDMLLVAASGVLWTRCCAGESGYLDVMETSKQLVSMQGGPVAMLERAKSIGPVKLRQVRSCLEEIVMWEEFSCLASGSTPDLSFTSVPPGATPTVPCELSSWYFAYSPPSGAPRSLHSTDWETIEAVSGVSRGVLELLHRVNLLHARSRPPEWSPSAPTALYPLLLDPIRTVEAQSLLAECGAWKAAYEAHQIGVKRTRLHTGIQVFATALEMILLMDLQFVRPDHPEIQDRASRIYQLVQADQDAPVYVFGLMWPVLIAASCALPSVQPDALAAIKTFSSYCCFDLNAAGRVVEKVWKRRESGDVWCSWRTILGEEGGGPVLA